MGMARVGSRKRCPKGWKLCQAQVSFQLETGSPGREGGGKSWSKNQKNLLTAAQDSHYSQCFKTGQVCFGFLSKMAKLPEDCFQLSLEQF